MLTEGELAQLRDDREALMSDACRVTRAGAVGTFNEATGRYDAPGVAASVYEGACRISPMPPEDQRMIFGERDIQVLTFWGIFPHDTPQLRRDDSVEVLKSTDSELVGQVLEITSVGGGGIHTARRVALQEVR